MVFSPVFIGLIRVLGHSNGWISSISTGYLVMAPTQSLANVRIGSGGRGQDAAIDPWGEEEEEAGSVMAHDFVFSF